MWVCDRQTDGHTDSEQTANETQMECWGAAHTDRDREEWGEGMSAGGGLCTKTILKTCSVSRDSFEVFLNSFP